jgi:hypothetical protein
MLARPNPRQRPSAPDFSGDGDVTRHRRVYCVHYDHCVGVAVDRGWRSWTCETLLHPSPAISRGADVASSGGAGPRTRDGLSAGPPERDGPQLAPLERLPEAREIRLRLVGVGQGEPRDGRVQAIVVAAVAPQHGCVSGPRVGLSMGVGVRRVFALLTTALALSPVQALPAEQAKPSVAASRKEPTPEERVALHFQATVATQAHMGSYRRALSDPAEGIDVTATRAFGRTKYGLAASYNQQIDPTLGMFVRASFNDGANETWVFTEIDRCLAAGAVQSAARWARPDDEAGAAVVLLLSSLSGDHRADLAAGGLGFIIGDGRLR